LIVLGVLSVIGGWIGIPEVISGILPGHPSDVFVGWLDPVIGHLEHGEHSTLAEWGLMGVSVSLAALGALFAVDSYLIHKETPKALAKMLGPVYGLVYNKYYVDEGYFAFLINPLVAGSKALWLYIDVNFIDKVTYVAGDLVSGLASFVKTVQNGKTQSYALYMALGLVVVMTFVLWQ
jgi:NADH-quinone oxidoreductase subunit L